MGDAATQVDWHCVAVPLHRHGGNEGGSAQVTEEDRYSSVIRDAQQQNNYSHLQQRFQQQQQASSQQPQQPSAGGAQPASQDVRSSNVGGPAAAAPGDGNAAPSPAKPPAWGNAGAGVAVLRYEAALHPTRLHCSAGHYSALALQRLGERQPQDDVGMHKSMRALLRTALDDDRGTNSWTRPGAVKTASQPIPVVDTRREHNKARQHFGFQQIGIVARAESTLQLS